jgi:hypothetical protein
MQSANCAAFWTAALGISRMFFGMKGVIAGIVFIIAGFSL